MTRGAPAAVRALAGAGWTVGVATPTGEGIAASSRYVDARHRVPAPSVDGEAFLSALESAIGEGSYDVVLAGGDAELMVISAGRDRLTATVPHAPHESVIRALDKLELTEAGRLAGWSVPATEAAVEGHEPSWSGPTVVKARWHSPGAGSGGPARIAGELARNGAEAVAIAERIRAAGGDPLFQAHRAGRLGAFVAVCDEGGEIVAEAAQVADAIWPMPLGASARASSVEVQPQLRDDAGALLAELDWFGIAEIQYLLDEDGNRWLIDLNARIYGSLQLAVAAGANLPVAWAALATGRSLPPDLHGRAGVSFRWMEGGVARSLSAPHWRLPAVLQALRPRRRTVGPVWMTRDPHPALSSVRSIIERRGGLRRIGRG